MFVDPQLTLTVTDGPAELIVSQNLPEAVPEPAAAPLAAAAALALQALAGRGHWIRVRPSKPSS